MKYRLTWSRDDDRRGPKGSVLRTKVDGKWQTLARTQKIDAGGWFFYARNDSLGVPLYNSCKDPSHDEADAKMCALAFVRRSLELAICGLKPALSSDEMPS